MSVAKRAAVALGAILSIAGVVWVARQASAPPSRCGDGLVALGARCCGEGQRLEGDRCAGAPSRCGPLHARTDSGCAPLRRKVELPGGRVRIGPSDWEAQGVVSPHEIEVRGFSIDAFEIDVARFGACVRAGSCRGPITDEDGGRAASLTFADAAALCTSEHGRLPRDDEWTFAAMGEHARRYPWGDTGAVCARAAYGLVDGPCATGAKGPDTVGARSLGASPEGIFDLAGNQAEWTIAPDGAPRLRGGSYASSLATELRGWSAGDVPSGLAVAGARCVYDD